MSELVGILGGIGPAAGGLLHQRIIERNVSAKKDSDHPKILLFSDSSIPNRVESFRNNNDAPVIPIVKALKKMSGFGVSHAVMACNTAHIWIDPIRSQTDLQVISVIDLVVDSINKYNVGNEKKVLILGTSATVEANLYGRMLAERGIEYCYPEAFHQALVDYAIADESVGIKSSGSIVSKEALDSLHSVVLEGKKQGVCSILLGCTELSIAIEEEKYIGCHVIDPINIVSDYVLFLDKEKLSESNKQKTEVGFL